jgi:hypothetical protein
MEKRKLQKLLEMHTGYVLGGCFSNASFQGFVLDVTEKDIYDKAYALGTGSKANVLRGFWTVEPNHVVGKLLAALLDVVRRTGRTHEDDPLFQDCDRIVQRLQQSAPVREIAAITPNEEGRDFEVLARSVRDAIERNEPESRLDHLHTFALKYLRVLCKKRGISVDQSKPLHSLMGEYVKRLKQEKLIESEMTELILKSSISTLQAFCDVRNDQSLAHDNPVLNYPESLLIFNYVTAAIRFIQAFEERGNRQKQEPPADQAAEDDVPF